MKGPNLGLLSALILSALIVGYIKAESEKDFEFAGDTLNDDEDFVADQEGSGDIEGSGVMATGVPGLFRAIINITSLQYTDEIRAAGRDIGRLAITQQIQAALQNLLDTLPGTIRIRVVDIQPGSLMVTFDLDTDGQQTEEEIVELLKNMLNRGSFSAYRVSSEGFDFRRIRDLHTCSPRVGPVPRKLPTPFPDNYGYLMINNVFPCAGFVTAWNFHREFPGETVFIGVFRQTTDTNFVLVDSTEIPRLKQARYEVDRPILVQKGDFIGVFNREGDRGGNIAFTTEAGGDVQDYEMYQGYRLKMFAKDIMSGASFQIADFENLQGPILFAVQADMSYLNVPEITTPAPVACQSHQWTCTDGECIDLGYYCDQQVDCYDGSDEENCPVVPTCREDEFRCGNSQQCIPLQFICNFVDDCGDNSDEDRCGPGPVRITSYRDGSESDRYMISWTRPQAGGGDIVSYTIKYRPVAIRRGELTSDGDYIIDRSSGGFSEVQATPSEENFLLHSLQPASYYQVEISANNEIGASEPQAFIFRTANAGCRPGEWQCDDGGCIDIKSRCNVFPDCADDSDEHGCSNGASCPEGLETCPQPDGAILCVDKAVGCADICAENEFQCLDGHGCISFSYHCDGRIDCNDLSDEANCECDEGEFQCVDGRNCIAGSRRCDSRTDCADGSDEANCPCPDGFFECLNTPSQECISTGLLCDDVDDCSDGSDENDCGCPVGKWQCADKSCIPDKMRCDGRPQCEDLSDEVGCVVTCGPDQYTCADGNCVEGSMRCDGVPQCEDQSDEDNCPCRDGMFQCRDSNCVEGWMKCDGVRQCEDGSDEFGCPTEPPSCPTSDFQCATTAFLECIDKRLHCDGYPDCSDSSDEDDCPGCKRNEFTCLSDGRCLPSDSRCNGHIECADRSDELSCECTSEQFKCGDGICIDLSRRCDRRIDCEDHSDEIACPCQSGEFQCVNGDCIDEARKCDGQVDCRDRSDEQGCPRDRRRCPQGYYQCGTGHCLSETRHCDGVPDCPDRSDERDCPLRCTEEEVECVVDNKCLTADQICNRVYDCSDGRDEQVCARCTSDEFQCESDRSCISLAGRCNGRKECSDGSDEMNCPSQPPISVVVSPQDLRIRQGAEAILVCIAQGLPSGARVEWFRGTEGLPMQSAVELGKLMIPVAKVMDSGDYTCRVVGVAGNFQATARLEVVAIGPTPQPDGDGKCGRDEAVCQNGECIRREYRCDGENDCSDGSDEPDDCYANLCEPNEFQCPSSGQCVMKIWRCDGENDCEDGFDESECRAKLPDDPCGLDEFECVSGNQCVPLAYQCDQEIDCLDRSDEIGCSPPIVTVPPVAEIEVELGATFTILCEAVGVPTPLIVWRLNWGNIPTGDRVTTVSVDGRGVLTVRDARYTDAGAYTCEAINNRGSIFAIPDALVIVRRQRGPCSPPFFNSIATTSDECVRCFCFGQAVQCFSSDLQVSRIALSNQMEFSRRESDGELVPVDQTFVNYRQRTGEYQVQDMTRALPRGHYYWQLPREFLGERLTSYGGEIKYTITYEIQGRTQTTTTNADVIMAGNGITLYYRARTVPSPDVPTSISVPLIESAWERSDGTRRRGDTPVDSQYANREDFMTVLENVEYVLIRGSYDTTQTSSRIGGVFMSTAVDYVTEFGQAYLVEECTCPTGYTGLSCQNCASGFTHHQTGGYLGQCVACSCNGHSNDCDPFTSQCVNCLHNTDGPQCQLCAEGYYGDARRGTPQDCQACPCPLTDRANQFSRSCYLDTDNDVTCANCPVGYEGRRCQRCTDGYVGDPMTPGSSCTKVLVDDYCDPRGSKSTRPNPLTRRCNCKENVYGERCDTCKAHTFYLSSSYELGCVRCFCMGVSKQCQSTTMNRAQVGVSFTRDDSGVKMTDMNGNVLQDQRLTAETSSRELVYRTRDVDENTLYWSLPNSFLGDKVTAYGGSFRFTIRYNSRQGEAISDAEPLVKISGNDITLIHRSRHSFQPNRPQPVNIMMYEENWYRSDGQPTTREHLLMALADLDSILIRATFERPQVDTGLRDVTLDIGESRQTRQDRAYAVESCQCPVGYRGLSCEDCDTGYTRSGGGLYLGLCEPCRCNGHSNECDPETGICRNCQHNTEGENCELCAVGFYGDSIQGRRDDCQKCPCPLTESPNQFSPTCMLDTDAQVTCSACPAGHTGRRCETCITGYSGNPLKVGDYCKIGPDTDCDCDTRGTVTNTQCDETSLQCQCKPYVQGRRCARCREGHFYLESHNPQGCLTCFCSGITDQCTSSNYYRDALRPQLGADGGHNFVLMNRRMNNIISDGFVVDSARNQVTYNQFEGVQQERESLFFQLPAKFRGDRVTSYGGYLRFTLEFTARPEGRTYRDVDLEIISSGQSLRLYNLFEPGLQEGRTQTYEILLRESSFNDLRSNTAPTRETFMTILSDVEGILIRATHHEKMASITLRDVSMDTAVATPTNLGGAPMVEDCRCPEGYTGLSCQRCADGYLRISDGRGGVGRCVRCNCNGHARSCDPDSGQCLECQHNTEGDRCERCATGYYGVSTSGTPNDCRACPCPLTTPPNQFSRTCYLADDNQVTCDRCPTGYSGRQCQVCAEGYVGDPSQPGGSCSRRDVDLRPDVVVSPLRVEEPEGSTAVFQCQVSGEGPFNVLWSRLDSRQLPGRSSVSPRYSLTLRYLEREDTGRYICTATNRYGITRQEVELKVVFGTTPLQVRIDKTRLEIEEGRTVRFVCTATGSSRTMTYILSWSKQGGHMPSKALDQNGVLVIPNIQRSDAGNYVCMGSDMFTMDEAVAVLIVAEPSQQAPTVRIEPRYQEVEEGTPVRFSCIATGDPTPKIEWYRGGNRELNPDSTVTSDGVFRIPRVQLDDESDYYCKATNELGTTEIRTILYVTKVDRPQITIIVRQTKYVSIVGETARLECYSEDTNGRVTLFWSRANGLPTGSSQDNGILTIPDVQPSYAGNYVCTGTETETGRVSTAIAVLEINIEQETEVPTVRLEPEKITIPMGTTGTLRCHVTGKPEPTVTWIKSREDLASNHQVNGNVLRITQATMADRGIYVCRAENAAGLDQDWTVVEVERRMRPKIDLYPNTTQTVAVGSSALFQCRVMDGDPPPTVLWSRVGGLPMSSDKIETMDNGVIMFKQITQAEQGGYICTAENEMGTTTVTATLFVEGPPTIMIQPSKTVYALIGQRVTLECTADGDPIPTVYWIEPDHPRRGDVEPEYDFLAGQRGTAIIDISSVAREDQGTYTCVASNSGGKTEDRVQLIVREGERKGVAISGPSTMSVVEGQSVELVCSANDVRNPIIRWRRREGALPPGHSVSNGVLTLPRFRPEYAGEYICSTTVQQQSYEASVFIIVTVAPRLTISPQRIKTRAGDTVQLRCTASGSGPFNIEWSRVGAQMNPSATEHDGVLEIRQVTAADAGRYRCVIRSSSGTNDGYAIVEVEVPPAIVVSQRNVYTEENRIAELRCDVSGSPAPTVRWEKEGDQLPAQHRIQDGLLTIYGVHEADAGRYICTASSSSGTSRDYAVLHVSTGSTIDNPDGGGVDTQVVNVGDRVSMECIVTGTPLPTITWSRDDGPLPKDSILGDGILIIPQAKIADAGTYTCLAVNEAGSISSKVVLFVRAQPLVRAPSASTAALGDRATLVCDASGFPSPDITWFRKEGSMPSDYTIVDGDLVISRVRQEDAGTYVCHAENQYGRTDTPVSLNVGALVPYFSQDPKSYMAYKPLNDVYLDFDILLSLKPESTEGMVLYNGQYEDGGGDFVCFGLHEGYPEFRFDVGSGPAIIRGNNTLGLNEWHTIKLTRNRKKGAMVVNEEPAYTGESPGYFTGLDLEGKMYLGSVPSYDNIPRVAGFREGFVGSISEVKLKGIDVNLGEEALEIVGVEPYNACRNRPCANSGVCASANTRYGFKCMCPQGYTGSRCQEIGESCYAGACGPNGRCYNLEGRSGFKCICRLGKTGMGCQSDVAIINPFFNRTSFISFPPAEGALFSLQIELEFKPQSLADGIILYEGNDRDGTGDFMAIVQKDGYLEFRFDTGSGPAIIRSRNPLRSGEWTRVTATRKNREGTLVVNNDDPVTDRVWNIQSDQRALPEAPARYYNYYNYKFKRYRRASGWPGTSPGSTVGLNLKLPLYLGGPDITHPASPSTGVFRGFVGCVAALTVNDVKIDLLNDAIESANIVDCGERRLCARQPCAHNAVCEDLPGPDFRCICGASYTGVNCEVEVNICLTNSPCQNAAPCSITNEGYRCDCLLGFAGDNCEYEINLNTHFGFAGDSFMELTKDLLPHAKTQERQLISFNIRTLQKDGLVLWQGEKGGRKLRGHDHISIGLKGGYIVFSYEMGSGPAMIVSRSRVDDGEKHAVTVERLGRKGSLTVDNDDMVIGDSQGYLQMLNAEGNIYIGGVSLIAVMTDEMFKDNFNGCLDSINIHGKGPIESRDAISGYNIQACSP